MAQEWPNKPSQYLENSSALHTSSFRIMCSHSHMTATADSGTLHGYIAVLLDSYGKLS